MIRHDDRDSNDPENRRLVVDAANTLDTVLDANTGLLCSYRQMDRLTREQAYQLHVMAIKWSGRIDAILRNAGTVLNSRYDQKYSALGKHQ